MDEAEATKQIALLTAERDAWKSRVHGAAGHIDALLLYATVYPTDSHALNAYAFLVHINKELGIRREPRTVATFARNAAGRSVMPPLPDMPA